MNASFTARHLNNFFPTFNCFGSPKLVKSRYKSAPFNLKTLCAHAILSLLNPHVRGSVSDFWIIVGTYKLKPCLKWLHKKSWTNLLVFHWLRFHTHRLVGFSLDFDVLSERSICWHCACSLLAYPGRTLVRVQTKLSLPLSGNRHDGIRQQNAVSADIPVCQTTEVFAWNGRSLWRLFIRTNTSHVLKEFIDLS